MSGSGFSCHDCLIVVDEDIRFTGSDHILDRVTLVAQDDIVFTGSKTDSYGILFAPNGELSYTGSQHELHHGGLIANDLDINGSKGNFCGFGDGGSGGPPVIALMK